MNIRSEYRNAAYMSISHSHLCPYHTNNWWLCIESFFLIG